MANISLVPFNREYLDHSWRWLNDRETKRLTLAGAFTRQDQERFFQGLPRPDYRIWGVEVSEGTPIGAAGIKNIRGNSGEFWGYIGEAAFRGKGLGKQMLELVEEEAVRVGIRKLNLIVGQFNLAALALYRKAGYRETGRSGDIMRMSKSLGRPSVQLVPYDRPFLDKSWIWLRDPEIKHMTMAPDFTREEQQAFFEALPARDDYKIWGVATVDGELIGAGGIKHIDGKDGEFWCYIGERSWWGRGIGGEILDLCEEKARALGVERLTMTALETNERSLNAYRKMGFEFLSRDEESGTITLDKSLSG